MVLSCCLSKYSCIICRGVEEEECMFYFIKYNYYY